MLVPLTMQYVLLVAGWALYFFLHSFLVTDRIKKPLLVILSVQHFRLVYSTFSTVGLVVLLFYAASLPPQYWHSPETWLRFSGLCLATFGVFIIFAAFKQYRVRSFLGLATDQNDFVRSGILTYVRHPLYSGIILVSLGYLLFVPSTASLISAGCIFLYLPIGIWLEERKLLRHFGDAYRQYRAKVPALVPRWPWR